MLSKRLLEELRFAAQAGSARSPVSTAEVRLSPKECQAVLNLYAFYRKQKEAT